MRLQRDSGLDLVIHFASAANTPLHARKWNLLVKEGHARKTIVACKVTLVSPPRKAHHRDHPAGRFASMLHVHVDTVILVRISKAVPYNVITCWPAVGIELTANLHPGFTKFHSGKCRHFSLFYHLPPGVQGTEFIEGYVDV